MVQTSGCNINPGDVMYNTMTTVNKSCCIIYLKVSKRIDLKRSHQEKNL